MGPQSIKAKKYQADEAIADWIAANVIGDYVMNLPANERQKAAVRCGGFFCHAYGDDFYKSSIILEESHPETTFRINGIYGTNTKIRAALGCSKKGPFTECTLKGAVK
jgi:hypothetical protein